MWDVPTVSVLMPVYNGEQWLSAAIESILLQTYSNFELLILLEYGSNKKSKVSNIHRKLETVLGEEGTYLDDIFSTLIIRIRVIQKKMPHIRLCVTVGNLRQV